MDASEIITGIIDRVRNAKPGIEGEWDSALSKERERMQRAWDASEKLGGVLERGIGSCAEALAYMSRSREQAMGFASQAASAISSSSSELPFSREQKLGSTLVDMYGSLLKRMGKSAAPDSFVEDRTRSAAAALASAQKSETCHSSVRSGITDLILAESRESGRPWLKEALSSPPSSLTDRAGETHGPLPRPVSESKTPPPPPRSECIVP